MFAIPVARELFGGSTTVEWVLILIAGACMTASAYFGIKSLTIFSKPLSVLRALNKVKRRTNEHSRF